MLDTPVFYRSSMKSAAMYINIKYVRNLAKQLTFIATKEMIIIRIFANKSKFFYLSSVFLEAITISPSPYTSASPSLR